MKKTKLNKQSKLPIAKLKKKLDVVFSQYARKYYSWQQTIGLIIDEPKFIHCYTCNAVIPLEKTQVSHFISRTHHSIRWELRNVRLCCARCNIFLNGNLAEFTLRLIDEKGREEVEWLRQEGRKIKKWTPQELEETIKKFST